MGPVPKTKVSCFGRNIVVLVTTPPSLPSMLSPFCTWVGLFDEVPDGVCILPFNYHKLSSRRVKSVSFLPVPSFCDDLFNHRPVYRFIGQPPDSSCTCLPETRDGEPSYGWVVQEGLTPQPLRVRIRVFVNCPSERRLSGGKTGESTV